MLTPDPQFRNKGTVTATEDSSPRSSLFLADDGPLVTGPLGPLVTDEAGRPVGLVDLSPGLPALRERLKADPSGRFPCPIPGHTGSSLLADPPPEEDPRGAGQPRLLCCSGRWRSLGEVWAARAYGADRKLSNIEIATWTRRLGHELGVFEPLGVLVPELPAGASRHASVARAGFQLLVGMRWADGPRRPVPYTVRFVAAWCGLSFRDAHESLTELRDAGVIQQADRVGRIPLYLPGRAQTHNAGEGRQGDQ
jgi:hypothetical protein